METTSTILLKSNENQIEVQKKTRIQNLCEFEKGEPDKIGDNESRELKHKIDLKMSQVS